MGSDKAKTICEWKGQIEAHWEELKELVSKPKYACRKCGRAASRKKVLCKPRAL